MLDHLDRESRKSIGDAIVVVVVFVAVMLAFAVTARCETPGIREIWAAPTNARNFAPSSEDFARVAGPAGYVVVLSPERAEHVVASLEAARDEAAACRLESEAQSALIDSLRKQVATLEAAHVTDGADVLRMDELTRSQRAMLRPRRGLAFVAGMAVGAGLVAGGVAVAR